MNDEDLHSSVSRVIQLAASRRRCSPEYSREKWRLARAMKKRARSALRTAQTGAGHPKSPVHTNSVGPRAAAWRTVHSSSVLSWVGRHVLRLRATVSQWRGPGADVARSRCRCGEVPVQMWRDTPALVRMPNLVLFQRHFGASEVDGHPNTRAVEQPHPVRKADVSAPEHQHLKQSRSPCESPAVQYGVASRRLREYSEYRNARTQSTP